MTASLGHTLFETRLQEIPEFLKGMLDDAREPIPCASDQAFLITGLGSSEAHARYLTHLINQYTPASAHFRSITDFHLTPFKSPRREILIVFSQGISANSQIALRQLHLFNGSILFTSSTEKGLARSKKADRAEFLKKVSHVIHFPLEEEFEILIRAIGPMAGYLACIQFINRQWPTKLPTLPKTFWEEIFTPPALPDAIDSYREGCLFISNSELASYGQNLQYKFVEGLFTPTPTLCDYLSFSHGPFQQLAQSPRPVVLLKSQGPQEDALAARCQEMLQSISITPWIIDSPHRTPLSIFSHEVALNAFLLQAMQAWKIDQLNWPGKGLDGPLYSLSE